MGADILEAEETLELAGLVNGKYLEIKGTYETKKAAHAEQVAALETGVKDDDDGAVTAAAEKLPGLEEELKVAETRFTELEFAK